MVIVNVITLNNDLARLVEEINQAVWDAANDISPYDVESLSAYLAREDTLFVACHEVVENASLLLGIASARLEIKPYDKAQWLYIDEVDVCADKRQQGAGKAIMKKLIELAKDAGCNEVWLGTEVDNQAANKLYKSLNPDEVAQLIGYAYELD